MRYLPLFALPLLFTAPAAAADSSTAQDVLRVQHCQVVLADVADLSPREVGILKKLSVTLGKQVDAGQVVMQLDDTKARLELTVAEAKLVAAQTKADDKVNEEYAIAAAATAKKELEYNLNANRAVSGTVPMAKIEELQLKCTETELGIKKAIHDQAVAKMEAGVAAAEVEAAKTMIELLEVKSPISGEVVDVRAHEGEAVQPAQPGVVRIVGLDRLRIQGEVDASKAARSQLERQPVTIEIPGQKISVRGEIIFVNPETTPGGTYQIMAEVRRENRNAPLPFHPGMLVEMVVPLKAEATR